jgi:hypothetical protein
MTPNEIAMTVMAVRFENCSRPIRTESPMTATEVNALSLHDGTTSEAQVSGTRRDAREIKEAKRLSGVFRFSDARRADSIENAHLDERNGKSCVGQVVKDQRAGE